MNIPENEIHVYYSHPVNNIPEIISFQNILSGDELDKAGRYKFEKDKINYINCRGTIRNILGKYLDISPAEINFSYSDKGKPYIKGSSIRFNLSHSYGFGVYALNLNDDIGIDTEYKRDIPDVQKIAERFFSEEEVEKLKEAGKGNDVNTAFFNCWTRKEAFIKAVGDGLSYPLKDFSVSLLAEEKPEILWMKNNHTGISEWSLYDLGLDKKHLTALAIKSKYKNIVIIDLKL